MLSLCVFLTFLFFFFFNDTATTEIYTVSDTLSLHDALPISSSRGPALCQPGVLDQSPTRRGDRKSTRLNSSHLTQYRMPSSACKQKKYKNNKINFSNSIFNNKNSIIK